MVEAVRIDTIDDESMTCLVAVGREDDGTTCLKFAVEQLEPAVVGVAFAIDEGRAIVVVEVMLEGVGDVFTIGAAASGAPHHIDGDAAMIAELGGLGLLFGCGMCRPAVFGQHQVPIVRGGAEIDGMRRAVVFPGVRAVALCGMLPIKHDLRHGGGHATYGCTRRTECVVGRTLVPFDITKEGTDDLRGGSVVAQLDFGMLLDVGGSLLDAFEPVLHVGGNLDIGGHGLVSVAHHLGIGGGGCDDVKTTRGCYLHLDTLALLDLDVAAWREGVRDLCMKTDNACSCQKEAEEVADVGGIHNF